MSSKFDLVENQLSLVIVGGFHPMNFTNELLKLHGVMNDEDFSGSETIFHNNLHVETKLPWVNIQVTPYSNDKNRLMLALTDPALFSQFMDLTSSICEMFNTTAVTALGINFTFITKHEDRESWDAFGHKILPPSNFVRSFGMDTDYKVGMNTSSIKFEHMLESVVSLENDEHNTELNVTVKPVYFDQSGDRIHFSSEIGLNYHFPITQESGMDGVYMTLKAYLAKLNEEVEAQVIDFVTGE